MAREEKEKKGFFSKLKESLSRTRDNLSGRVDQLVANYEELDDDFYDELLIDTGRRGRKDLNHGRGQD